MNQAVSRNQDTVFALATAMGRAGIAIIRISGPQAGDCLDRLATTRPQPRRATLRPLVGQTGELLDRALVLWFPGPRSYTGEDCAEFHLHAGSAVIEAVADALRQAGARPAEPGEFTQRAFLNGRIDLLEAEGIADLIEAETQSQRRQALAQTTGALSEVTRGWMRRLTTIVGRQEAHIDFPDEADDVADDEINQRIASLEQDLAKHLSNGARGEALRRGVVVALIGAPNVGKSSLINALTGRDVSIVTDRPGTTRDLVEARIVLGGIPVSLVDTAGLRDTHDEIEQEGVKRAMRAERDADVRLLLSDDVNEKVASTNIATSSLWVANKIDVKAAPLGAIGVSARTGEGVEMLRAQLTETVQRLAADGLNPVITRARHRHCLETTLLHLRTAAQLKDAELRGEELRLALTSLGALAGAASTEDILTEIFSTFCIGK